MEGLRKRARGLYCTTFANFQKLLPSIVMLNCHCCLASKIVSIGPNLVTGRPLDQTPKPVNMEYKLADIFFIKSLKQENNCCTNLRSYFSDLELINPLESSTSSCKRTFKHQSKSVEIQLGPDLTLSLFERFGNELT